jgi:hypothetical protein
MMSNNTDTIYKEYESAIQTLIKVLPLLSSVRIDADDKRVDEVREVEEDYNAGVLSQDEVDCFSHMYSFI